MDHSKTTKEELHNLIIELSEAISMAERYNQPTNTMNQIIQDVAAELTRRNER